MGPVGLTTLDGVLQLTIAMAGMVSHAEAITKFQKCDNTQLTCTWAALRMLMMWLTVDIMNDLVGGWFGSDASFNSLSGSLPTSWSSLTQMTEL